MKISPRKKNCAQCDFNTEFVPRLIKHLKSHYKCHLCGKKFQGNHGSGDLVSQQQKYPKVPKPKISFKYSKQIVKEIPYDCSISMWKKFSIFILFQSSWLYYKATPEPL